MSINECLPFYYVNDSELISLYDDSNMHNFPLDIIDNLSFCAVAGEGSGKGNVDENLIHISKEPKCNYIFCDNSTANKVAIPNLNILAYNINSVPKHLDDFSIQCLNRLQMDFDVIGFCETRLTNSICNIYDLSEYTSEFKNKSTVGGGLVLYIHDKYQYKVLDGISFQLPHIESLFVKVSLPSVFIIGIIYRPPNSDVVDFMSCLENVLNFLLSQGNYPCYIMGDLNINLLRRNDAHVCQLLNLFYSYYYYPTITKPTRVTPTTATLIDHIWTNNMENYETSGIIYTTISDHFPIFSSFSLSSCGIDPIFISVFKRKFTNESICNFKEQLGNYDWKSEIIGNDVNEEYDSYIRKFYTHYEENFPLREIKVKKNHMGKPFITTGITKSIKHRNRLQKLYAKWPITYGNIFKKYRNMLTKIIRSAKENYCKSELKQHAGDKKKTWNILNSMMGKNTQSHLPAMMNFDDKALSSNLDIAEEFNKYFCNLPLNLAQNVPQSSISFETYLPEPVQFSFYLYPTTQIEIKSVIKELKKSSPGHDDIDIRVIKECCDEISPFLEYIINKSFRIGCFPSQLEIAQVVTVHKKGDKLDNKNYRPISILPAISKIFEKIMAIRLLNYLTCHSLLTNCQFGFRPKYSTELALHKITQQIYNAIDNKKIHVNIFCDLAKAFDTIPHSILLTKLFAYGIRGPAHQCFASYLRHRKQYVKYNNAVSKPRDITTGVPQGSILGPLLFLVFINDLPRSSNDLEFLIFADDTAISVEGHDSRQVQHTIDTELPQVHSWLISNKLTLNINKTHYMVTHPSRAKSSIRIKINNIELEEVKETKFLGVTIDNNLHWKSQIQDIKVKISKIVGVIHKVKKQMDRESLKQIYMSLMYPHLLYCSSVWGGAYQTCLQDLFVTQKKAVRAITNSQKYEHTNPLFHQYNLLKLQDIISMQTLLFVYNAITTCPLSIDYRYVSRSIETRRSQAMDLLLPRCRTSHAQQSVLVRGVKLWNKLPINAKKANSKATFKKLVGKELTNNYV